MSSFLIGSAGNHISCIGKRALPSASHTTGAQKTRMSVGFQECHADIRLATDHLQFISLGGSTVVIVLAGLSTNLVTCQAQFCLGTFVTFPSSARPQDFRIKR